MQTATPSSGVLTLDQTRDNVFLVPLSANVTSVVFINNTDKAGQTVEIHFVQDSTGSRTVAGWPSTVKLAGGAITLTTTASKADVLRLRQVGDNNTNGGIKYREVSRSLNDAG